MDPRKNPYAPGAGIQPPELSGRGDIVEKADIAMDRIRDRLAARGMIYYGLRGVGKTVLLNRVRQDAIAKGLATVWIEAAERRSLPALLAPALRSALLKLDAMANFQSKANRALRALGSFTKALKIKYGDIDLSLDLEGTAGLADSGNLDNDMSDLIGIVGEAAQDRNTAIVIFVDELQYIPPEQMASLIIALHSASQARLPVMMMAAGLPQLLGQMGKAKSYSERLFEFIRIDRLERDAAASALTIPAAAQGVEFTPDALDIILEKTQCYPYFIQEWGKHAWETARQSPITASDAETATQSAIADLDASFFRVRFDRLTPLEKHYVRAMAELGEGPHRSGDIAEMMGRKVTAIAPVRNSLIAKGMVYSPAHGDTAFTVPLFEGFLKRAIPELY